MKVYRLRYHTSCSLSAIVLGACGFAQIGIAQVAAVPPAGTGQVADNSTNAGAAPDIIVTAERRSQRLQDVPISITAITGASLETQGVTNTAQLSEVTPGLVAPGSLSGNAAFTPFIRGVGSATAVPGIDASVALYIDGVYQASKYLNQIDLANIDRAEVLKGPQGTLYGRNATGGAINIITKRPSDTLQGDASFSYGSFNETEEKGYLTGPIAHDLNASIGVVAHQGGDYGFNEVTGHKFGGLDSVTVNGKIAWDPTTRLRVDLSATYAKRDGRRFDDSYAFAPGVVPPGGLFGGLYSTNPRQSYTDLDPQLDSHSFEGALHLRYSLDHFDLVSISSYKKGTYKSQLDSDGTSLPILAIRFRTPSRTITQELQAVSTGPSAFQWIFGGYYINSNENYSPFEVDVAPTPVQYFANTGTRAESAFGQASYQFGPETKLTGGLRYSIEKRLIDTTLLAPDYGDLVLGATGAKQTTFKKLTWRLSLDHKLTKDVLVYASYNRGFKSGAYNPLSADPNLEAAKPEVLDAYEVGVKSQFADRRIQINAAGYYYDYKNIQVQHVVLAAGSNSVAVLENAASATLYGLDGDVALVPVPALRLDVGFNLEHSKYNSYDSASGFDVAHGGGTAVIDETGAQVIGAPTLTFNASGSYTVDLAKAGSLLFAVSYSHTSSFSTAPESTYYGQGSQVFANGMLNGSIALAAPEGRFKIEAWARNLTDVKVYGSYTTALGTSETTQPPRSFGVKVSTNF